MSSDWLDRLERAGNRLPDPATLFLIGTLAIMLLSQFAVSAGWSVDKVTEQHGTPVTQTVSAVSLLDADGLWWVISHLVDNFVNFPPLGLVLVALIGIGVAERAGLLPTLLRRLMESVSDRWLVPVTIFVGINSSIALDAGYVVLPPLAGALFAAAGRSPLVGIGAATAGVTAGFSANLLITGLDPLLAGLSTSGAHLIDPDYQVAVTANWWFMIASTLLLTAAGTAATRWLVEPRQAVSAAPAAAASSAADGDRAAEDRGLRFAAWVAAGLLAGILALIWLPGAPLHGSGERFPRWMEAMVPLLLVFFLGIGLAYGIGARTIRNDRDAVRMMSDTMKGMGPYIVLVFFAAQFIAVFGHSRLGEMLAIAGGRWLAALDLSAVSLMLAFVLVVMLGNLIMGSASAKYAFFAPVFVPMFMQAGISPELTQAAYRVGDSVTNGITPFNPYLVIILAFVRRYLPDAGLGTLLALMLPYALVFAAAWGLLLGVWVAFGWELGPGGPLRY
ncbi:MAG: AbgT family transporter [Gammaproteobacteria bacterium]|nr:AbgT family transporter [Gammaproteobacteria bacterium]